MMLLHGTMIMLVKSYAYPLHIADSPEATFISAVLVII